MQKVDSMLHLQLIFERLVKPAEMQVCAIFNPLPIASHVLQRCGNLCRELAHDKRGLMCKREG
jgi:hypothetical protein